MKAFLFAGLIALAAAPAFAADAPAKKPLTVQQQRMKDCNVEAKTKALKGDERKAFMKTCLSGKHAAAAAADDVGKAKSTQQNKMKSCSAEAKAKALKGDARKTFMSTCLKG